jgi:hypothetical protein
MSLRNRSQAGLGPKDLVLVKRFDRIATELPPPSDPDPAGAAAVQELMGGRFGEMFTFMNYTFQSFNFRDRQGARPFYDLVAKHRRGGVRTRRARRDGDQHDADGRLAREQRAGPLVACDEDSARGRQARVTRTTSSPPVRARCHKIRMADPGTATTSSPPAT